MSSAEIREFAAAVDQAIAKNWGGPVDAPRASVAELWTAGATLGWFELARAAAFPFAVAAASRLGRAACPLSIVDAYAADELLTIDDIAAGVMRVAVVADERTAGTDRPIIDAGQAATHILVVPPSGGTARLVEVNDAEPLPGLAIPSWTAIELGQTVAEVRITLAQATRALTQVRLGKAASAIGAAQFAHELAIDHAKSRKQFGKLIGSFGAVQQRTAQCQIELRSAQLLLDDAVSAQLDSSEAAALAAEFAIAHITAVAPRVQLGAHHTLAAIGYFEEHPAPWLFRRVHADVTMLMTVTAAHGSVGDVLAESEASLPTTDLGPTADAFRTEYRQFIADRGAADKALRPAALDEPTVTAMAQRGWFGFGWPPEYGGRSATLAEQVVLNEETIYLRVAAGKPLGAVSLIGAPILRHGTEDQKRRFLPIIAAGQMNFCLGYSEPEAGSDLASLRTSAVRDGDSWTINGQKLWTTGAHQSEWVWLAARTNPGAEPRHAGITVFLFPLDTPGVTIQEHTALSGDVSCSVFYDDVRVPDSARVGEVDGGWKVVVEALAGERMSMGNIAAAMHRQLDDILNIVRTDVMTYVGGRGSAKRKLLGDLAVAVQANRALVAAAVKASGGDLGAMFDAAMAGVMAGDLAEEFGEATLELFGPSAALGFGSPEAAPGGGAFEYGLRQSIMFVVGGGTNDVQRGLISRGLGLPR